MIFPVPLEPGILLKRYKRFLADIELENNEQVTVHCPNSGSMLSCSAPGSPVLLSRSSNPKRKYPLTLEMVRHGSTWIGINTSLTNHLVVEGIGNGQIAELRNADSIQREVKVSQASRLDVMLTKGARKIYVEIKSCTLAEGGCAMFPDAVTARGTRHLRELARLVGQGAEGIIFFLVQRLDADSFRPAAHIDPLYAETLVQVHRQGVQILTYQAEVLPQGIRIVCPLPFSL
ncbi:MAG: DNA/RNA nuclease SfsA [Desulfocapsaceae bacterium]|nr:DNA/RNA nuclease SfsA [Desulfocapsaceae bacterium]